MLIRINDLPVHLFQSLKLKLEEAFTTKHIRSKFQKDTQIGMILENEHQPTTIPRHYCMTYASVYQDEIIGVFQAFINETVIYEIKCIDTLMINLSNRPYIFGKDHRAFLNILVDYCHRIESSAYISPTNPSPHDGVNASRHFNSINGRYVGKRTCALVDMDGNWADIMMWEAITPKGEIFYKQKL